MVDIWSNGLIRFGFVVSSYMYMAIQFTACTNIDTEYSTTVLLLKFC